MFCIGGEASKRIAAIAPVAGACWIEPGKLERPVPMCYITGTADPLNLIEGGVPKLAFGGSDKIRSKPKPPVRDSIQKWAKAVGETNEDCLYLNVWAPVAKDDLRKLPVMFWIHGGGFLFGSGGKAVYDGTELAKRGGVVVVTCNYRLGPIGFLAHPALAAERRKTPSS